MTMQYLPDGASGKAQLMKAQQLALQTLGTQMALAALAAPAAHIQDEGLVLWRDFALAQLCARAAYGDDGSASAALLLPEVGNAATI